MNEMIVRFCLNLVRFERETKFEFLKNVNKNYGLFIVFLRFCFVFYFFFFCWFCYVRAQKFKITLNNLFKKGASL